jgi:hypothetical protein
MVLTRTLINVGIATCGICLAAQNEKNSSANCFVDLSEVLLL